MTEIGCIFTSVNTDDMPEKILSIDCESFVFDPEKPFAGRPGKNSVVWKGHNVTGTPVVIKKLRGFMDPEHLLLNKYQKMSGWFHPALPKIYGLCNDSEGVYAIHEYIEGIDLKTWLQNKGRFTEPAVVKKIALDLLEALQVMHELQLIHTDIKPANIILKADGKSPAGAVLIDPGEALDLSVPLPAKKPFPMVYGAPEQVLGMVDLICPATDIYALGVVLWEMFTGEKPFSHTHPAKLINLQLNRPLQQDDRIPAGWWPVLEQATAKTVLPRPPAWYSPLQLREMIRAGQGKRFQTAAQMKQVVSAL